MDDREVCRPDILLGVSCREVAQQQGLQARSFIRLKPSFDPDSLRLTQTADFDPGCVISDLNVPEET